MNILMCTHPEADYGASFLLNGFARLGHHVIDYPAKLSNRGSTHRYLRPWHNNEEGCTAPLAWAKGGILPPDAPEYELEGVRSLLLDGYFDLVVVESGRWGALAAFAQLEQGIRAACVPILLLDGEDYSAFNVDAIRQVRPTLYAKRELLKSEPADFVHAGTRVVACPFSAPDALAALPVQQQQQQQQQQEAEGPYEYDCIFLAGNTHPNRLAVADALKAAAQEQEWNALVAISGDMDRNLGVHGTIAFPEYILALARSRCGVSVRGHGWDTCRLWETAVLTGLVTDELDIHIPHAFRHLETCLRFFDDPSCLLKWAKENPEDYAPIRRAGITHAREFHTNSARARYLLGFLL